MTHCIIHKDDKIIHYIKDCVVQKRHNQKGYDYLGSNRKLYSIKTDSLSIKWTDEELEPNENNEYPQNPNEISEANYFEGTHVSTDEDINNKIKSKISEVYSIEDEIKILRLKLNGQLSEEEWNNYNDYIDGLREKGSILKMKLKEVK